MSTAAQKQQYLTTLRTALTTLGQLVDTASALDACYVDRNYDAAAIDPILQTDLDPFGVIPYDLGAAYGLLQSLVTLVNGTPVNRATVSKWRQL